MNIKKYGLEVLLHLLFWIAVTYMLSSITSISISQQTIHNGLRMVQNTFRSFFPLCLITVGFLMLLFYGNVFWLFKKAIQPKITYKQVVLICAWFAFTYLANYFVIGFFWHDPGLPIDSLSHLIIVKRSQNDWDHRQLLILSIFLFMFGLSVAYYFVRAWIKNEFIKKQLEAHQLSTELKFLKSQVNPHFLFNTLNNLFSMAQSKGNNELADGISRLSGMMRYMIYESNTGNVSLSKEIAYLEDAILLNKLRYADDEVNVTFNYPQQTDDLTIAPMLFIPFVENAFKHGVLIGQQSPIDILISIKNKRVIFTCKNKNYSFIKRMTDDHSGIGLENVKRRLMLVYGNNHTLDIKNEEDKFTVILEIDLS